MTSLASKRCQTTQSMPMRANGLPFFFIPDRVRTYQPDADLALICSAMRYAVGAHKGQTRRSGKPFVVHPLSVAFLLSKMNMDDSCVAAGALHDTLENTPTTLEDLRGTFGNEVAALVDGVTNIKRLRYMSKEQLRAEGFRRMMQAMTWDQRVLIIKLADRLHNLRTLDAMPVETQRRIASESLNLYAPLASRLGIYKMQRELEDLAFRYLSPDEYWSLRALRSELLRKWQPRVAKILHSIGEMMDRHGIPAIVKFRTKSLYSIHQSMRSRNTIFNKVHDVVAFRILVSDPYQCYAALGLIHSFWRPVPGRFKDYIASRKPNKYQSLHTTVFGPDDAKIEVQIRTHAMERVAERGIISHWMPEPGQARSGDYGHVIDTVRQIIRGHHDPQNPLEFSQSVAETLFSADITVFTLKGDVIELPQGSTVLDLAYTLNTWLGHKCRGALLNERFEPIDCPLRSGDVVEILTAKTQEPSRSWLEFVKTQKARSGIEHYLDTKPTARLARILRGAVDRSRQRFSRRSGARHESGASERPPVSSTSHSDSATSRHTSGDYPIAPGTETRTSPLVVRLRVMARSRRGLLAEIASVISSFESDILKATIDTDAKDGGRRFFDISLTNPKDLDRIKRALSSLNGVRRVEIVETF